MLLVERPLDMIDFVHLHNHSEFSLLDGLSKIKPMILRAKELGMKALAITDHGNMYGTIKFYQEALKQGIKPIIGVEAYLAKRGHTDKEAGIDKNYNHLILLAENNTGYKNLMKLVSLSNLDGYYYKPRMDLEILKQYHEGIIALSACLNGYFAKEILEGKMEEAEKKAKQMYEIFGEGNYFLELQGHDNIPSQKVLNEGLIKISRKLGIPLVATNDNHYTNKDDAYAHDILLAIQTQTTVLDENRPLRMIDSPDFYIKTGDEMAELFKDTPDAITNTVKIAERCNVEITLGKWIMPNFEVPEGMKTPQYLRQLVEEGIKMRYGEEREEVKKRVEYELSIIIDKGYETYFLVVQDFVNWAKDNGIAVGPGRGSAAGSVVAYALRITDVDPFFFNLPFERFLNPFRPSAPDIDLDFADTRRDEVIAYVTEKYGSDKVAQIITFGTMEAKGAVRDAGRALGMPYIAPDRISKMIPPGWQGHAMTLDMAMEQSQDLKRAYITEPDTRKLIDVAKKLEGVARHASVHAAGVVIANKPLTEYVPLQRETNGDKVVTQYDMYTVGEDGVGLLKMDFLGLRNLTIIEETLKFIKINQGKDVDFQKLPVDDEATYKLLASGETTGIFQLESAGMRRYIKELKPTTIFDLMAMVALYRPGPMQNIPEFIARKHDPKLVRFPDPRLKDILSNSYGILTYQDDVLLTTIALAGYTWLDADKFRKAMGKKIPAEMKKQKEIFLEGAVKNGLTQNKAEQIFELIAPFAGYGFNKAHASCYATIAYRTAFLKAHYPVEFMTALLTAENRGTSGPAKNDKIAQAIAECRRLNLSVLPPSVNKSLEEFSIEENTNVRFGLSAIKNVGTAAISSIIEARKAGPFLDLYDFCERVDLAKVNKKTLESLMKAGAMDEFGKRATLVSSMPVVLEQINREGKRRAKSQVSLFGEEDDSIKKIDLQGSDMEEFTDREKLMFERELLGFFLTNHPLTQDIAILLSQISHKIPDLLEEKSEKKIKTGGLLSQVKKIITKKSNKEMAFLTIEDDIGNSIECVVFPKTYELSRNLLTKDTVVILDGKLDFKDDRPVVIVDIIQRLKN